MSTHAIPIPLADVRLVRESGKVVYDCTPDALLDVDRDEANARFASSFTYYPEPAA